MTLDKKGLTNANQNRLLKHVKSKEAHIVHKSNNPVGASRSFRLNEVGLGWHWIEAEISPGLEYNCSHMPMDKLNPSINYCRESGLGPVRLKHQQ